MAVIVTNLDKLEAALKAGFDRNPTNHIAWEITEFKRPIYGETGIRFELNFYSRTEDRFFHDAVGHEVVILIPELSLIHLFEPFIGGLIEEDEVEKFMELFRLALI